MGLLDKMKQEAAKSGASKGKFMILFMKNWLQFNQNFGFGGFSRIVGAGRLMNIRFNQCLANPILFFCRLACPVDVVVEGVEI